MKNLRVNKVVDGINLNATHFASMDKEAGVKAILADGIANDFPEESRQGWAEKAYDECKGAVDSAKKEIEKKLAGDTKEITKATAEAAKTQPKVVEIPQSTVVAPGANQSPKP